MSTNQYAHVDCWINSILVGPNYYRVLSSEEAFADALVEEITSPVRQQTPGRSYMEAQLAGSKENLWMVPFHMGEQPFRHFLKAVETVQNEYMGKPYFRFPLDVAVDGNTKAILMAPIDQSLYFPLRIYMPNAKAPRWQIAMSLFRRVQEMMDMGITSNGLSREQLRVGAEDNEVTVWLNETMSQRTGTWLKDPVTKHLGFLSIPLETQNRCHARGRAINGHQRDLFSAATAAFYLLMFSHPFIGKTFYSLTRSEYLNMYQNNPQYIMEPDTENDPGNQMLSHLIRERWEHTVPELRNLFDGLFLAITHPDENWSDSARYWDPQYWLRALEMDAAANAQNTDGMDYHFENEMYHMV